MSNVYMFIDMFIEMFIDMFTDMFIDMFIDMSIDMFIDISTYLYWGTCNNIHDTESSVLIISCHTICLIEKSKKPDIKLVKPRSTVYIEK